MILLILLLSLMSIGLLGILIVVTYACVTTKTLHTFCSSLITRKPRTRIKYAADQDYAERVCESVEQNLGKSLQNLGDRDSVISLSAVSSEDDDDEARIEDHLALESHYHLPGVACDCTDYEGSEVTLDSPASFDRRQRGVVVEVVKFNSPLVGVIV